MIHHNWWWSGHTTSVLHTSKLEVQPFRSQLSYTFRLAFGYYLRLQVIHASNPVATNSHVEFYTNNKWEEVFLEMKMINSQWRIINRSRNNCIATSIKFGNASHVMPEKIILPKSVLHTSVFVFLIFSFSFSHRCCGCTLHLANSITTQNNPWYVIILCEKPMSWWKNTQWHQSPQVLIIQRLYIAENGT